MNISLKKGNYSWREQRKVHNKKEDPKGMDHYFQIREEVGLPDIEKKGYRTRSLMLLPKEKRKHKSRNTRRNYFKHQNTGLCEQILIPQKSHG